MMECPYCGSDVLDYLGVSDGGGDYGDSLCDEWSCMDCGAVIQVDCLDDSDSD